MKALYAAGLLCVVSTSGCSLISLSAIGSIAELGNSSVTGGRDTYYFGKLRTAAYVDLATARAATLAAAADLGLRLVEPEQIEDDGATLEFAFADEWGDQIGVELERRAGSMVLIKCDIGFVGSEITDRLFLRRLRAHLPGEGEEFPIYPTTRPA